ncbi:expressed protein [Phakopsora pachyrhizi]|uniref:Expressed protein n=1 Tax=Phakopsora pachyrhizi TaxID=170000 RepID=A0AAV0B6Z9_PHAPC|nr:expressed protein [Phakopsora pachyrhizi]
MTCSTLAFYGSLYDFEAMVTSEIMPSTPEYLCASYRVENLVASTNSKYASIVMGSQEDYGIVDQAISTTI